MNIPWIWDIEPVTGAEFWLGCVGFPYIASALAGGWHLHWNGEFLGWFPQLADAQAVAESHHAERTNARRLELLEGIAP